MLIFKFLHIAFMFAAVTLVFGSILFADLVARRGDAATYVRFDAIVQRTDAVAILLFVVGLILGFVTALVGGLDLAASWLVLAYILVAALFIEGLFVTIPRYNHIRHVAKEGDPATAGAEIARLVRAPAHVALVVVVAVLWLSVIYVMVVKPTLF